MNLAKLALCSCPIALATFVLLSRSTVASVPHSPAPPVATNLVVDHGVTVAIAPPADRPLLPTGCTCARCTKPEERLQGQFPVF